MWTVIWSDSSLFETSIVSRHYDNSSTSTCWFKLTKIKETHYVSILQVGFNLRYSDTFHAFIVTFNREKRVLLGHLERDKKLPRIVILAKPPRKVHDDCGVVWIEIEWLSHVLQVWGLSYHVVGFGINPWIQAMCSYTEENERGAESTQYVHAVTQPQDCLGKSAWSSYYHMPIIACIISDYLLAR